LVFLDVDREDVKHSPPYDSRITVDGTYEASSSPYYGTNWILL
jgi:uncharacterized protein YeaO (DUF488 family)